MKPTATSDSRFDVGPFLEQREGQHFDRKSMWHGPAGRKQPRNRKTVREVVAEYVAAFANADGGVLLLGIEDDGAVTGHDLPAAALDSLLGTPEVRLDPPQPRGFVVRHGDCEVIVFDVPACDVPVQMKGNGFPLRVGDQTIQAKESRIAETKRQGMYESWENRPSPCALADLDSDLLSQARQQAGLAALTNEDYLLKRKLADRHGARIVLRRAAELLFVRGDPDHPNAGVRVFRVIGSERLTGALHNVEELPRIEGNLPTVLEAAQGVVRPLLRRPSRLLGGRFHEVSEYPDFAWREAILNAILHRDYAVQGMGVEVWLFEDHMEVVSAGTLPQGVTLQEVLRLERLHVSRNPRLVRVLVDLGQARDQGEGIPRMFAEMESIFLPRPKVEVKEQRVVVTLENMPTLTTADRRFLAGLGNTDMGTEELRVLLTAFRHGKVDNAALRSTMGLDTLAASQLLRGLRDRGLLRLHPHGAQSYYTLMPILTPAADADREKLDADREKLGLDRGKLDADRGKLGSGGQALPEDLLSAIDHLGNRPRKESVRAVIQAICAVKPWTTREEIAKHLRFSQKKLGPRHLAPMVAAGWLQVRYPEQPTHPNQAYRSNPDRGKLGHWIASTAGA